MGEKLARFFQSGKEVGAFQTSNTGLQAPEAPTQPAYPASTPRRSESVTASLASPLKLAHVQMTSSCGDFAEWHEQVHAHQAGLQILGAESSF